MSEITRLLQAAHSEQPDAVQQLITAVYDELRRMAAAKLVGERAGHSLNATSLVHEAFLKLSPDQRFESRRHFFGAASEAMRRILIDRARARNAVKRGGEAVRVDLSPDQLIGDHLPDDRLVELNEALERFETLAPEKAALVKLRYFVGLSIREAAEVMGISTATADRHWAYAKSWLQAEVQG